MFEFRIPRFIFFIDSTIVCSRHDVMKISRRSVFYHIDHHYQHLTDVQSCSVSNIENWLDVEFELVRNQLYINFIDLKIGNESNDKLKGTHQMWLSHIDKWI